VCARFSFFNDARVYNSRAKMEIFFLLFFREIYLGFSKKKRKKKEGSRRPVAKSLEKKSEGERERERMSERKSARERLTPKRFVEEPEATEKVARKSAGGRVR
jgi:hypothetical protein